MGGKQSEMFKEIQSVFSFLLEVPQEMAKMYLLFLRMAGEGVV